MRNILTKLLAYRKEQMLKDIGVEEVTIPKEDMLPLLKAIPGALYPQDKISAKDRAIEEFELTGDYACLAEVLRGARIFGMNVKLEMDKFDPQFANPFDAC